MKIKRIIKRLARGFPKPKLQVCYEFLPRFGISKKMLSRRKLRLECSVMKDVA